MHGRRRSGGGTGGEGFLDGRGYFLGDAELVDHAGDDQAAAVDVERGGVAVLVQVHGGGGSRRLLDLQRLLGAASVGGYLVAAAEFVLQCGGSLLQRYGSFDCHGRHSRSPSMGRCALRNVTAGRDGGSGLPQPEIRARSLTASRTGL